MENGMASCFSPVLSDSLRPSPFFQLLLHPYWPTAGAPGGSPPPCGSEFARAPGGGGGGPTTAAAAPVAIPDGRACLMSTGSDPNDQPSSLLARIIAKARDNEVCPFHCIPQSDQSLMILSLT